MNDAPEKIWAHAPTTFDEMDVWQTSETDGAIEYTRTDVTDARITELERELGHCIYELNRADSRKPHRDRRAGLARAVLKVKET
jgi:hypothetical protein